MGDSLQSFDCSELPGLIRAALSCLVLQDTDWRELYKGHACFTPGKDLNIPLFKPPHKFLASPLMGSAPLERDLLLYFRCGVAPFASPICHSYTVHIPSMGIL